MAYSFLFGGNTGETPESLSQRRDLISRLIMGQETPRNWGEGVGSILTGLAAGIERGRVDKAENEGRKGATDAYNKIFSTLTGGSMPAPQSAGNIPQPGAASELTASAPGGNQNYRDAIASIESAGSGDYNAVGPTHPKLGRALGRYQVMEANIGPWSQAALGRAVTPDEFMANPQIQDQIFDHQFGQYVNQYGPEGAAQAWFGGPGGVGKLDRTDSLGTSIGDYGQRFMRATEGGGAEVASLDPAAGMQPAAAAIEQQAPGSGYVDPMVSAPNYDPQQAAATLPPLPSREVGPSPQVAPVQPMQPAPQPTPQPQQMAQAMSGPSLEELLQLQGNPWLSDEQKAVVGAMIEQRMQERDPYRQLQMQKLQQELNTPAKRDTTTINGRLVDAQTGQVIADYPDQEKPTNDQQNYEYYRDFEVQNGRQPLGPLEWEQAQRKAGAMSVTTNVGEGDKFYENLDKKNAETFSTLSEGGMTGRSRLAQLSNLETIMRDAPTGAGARVKLMLGDLGINTEGLSDLQATRSLLEKMVPEQRAAGSGPMSDADIVMYRRSLPDVINQPGGNELIFGTAKAIAQYDIQMGEIADMVADREITPAEGRKRIRELKNPLDGYADRARAIRETQNSGGQAPRQITQEEYQALPSGAEFIAPDGSRRRKP